MKRLFYFLILAIFVNSCAPLPRVTRRFEKVARRNYISIMEFARKYDFQVDFDPFLKNIYLSKGERIEIALAFESPWALVNGQEIYLGGKVEVKDGDVQIPLIGANRILTYLTTGRYEGRTPRIRIPEEVYRIRKIVIDPGHGGKDPGAIGPTGLKEKDVVLSIAKILKRKLESAGYEVVLTREDDRYISLWRRIYIANREGADLFISIHANSARYRRASGFEVYYLAEATDEEARALAAAENYPLGFDEELPDNIYVQATIWDLLYAGNREESMILADRICRALNRQLGTRNRGVKSANFYVLRGVQMPAVLVEVGFISNRYEEKKLRDWGFKNRIAEAILEGIRSYEREYAFRRRAGK